MTLDPDLRALLVCPVCRAELEDHAEGLVCRGEHPQPVLYPVVDGVPHLVPELSRPLNED